MRYASVARRNWIKMKHEMYTCLEYHGNERHRLGKINLNTRNGYVPGNDLTKEQIISSGSSVKWLPPRGLSDLNLMRPAVCMNAA